MWIETEDQTAVDANEITAIRLTPEHYIQLDRFGIEFVVRGHDRAITYKTGQRTGPVMVPRMEDPAVREAIEAAKAAVEAAKCHCRH